MNTRQPKRNSSPLIFSGALDLQSIINSLSSVLVGVDFKFEISFHSQAVMELVYFRNGKMIYFRFRYRIRIITVFVLRMRVWRKVMLKLSSFFAFSSVSVLIKHTNRLDFFYNCIALTNTVIIRIQKTFHHCSQANLESIRTLVITGMFNERKMYRVTKKNCITQ